MLTAFAAGFSAVAAAQQNDFFDIEKYLAGKHKKKNMTFRKAPLTTQHINVNNFVSIPLTSSLSKRTFSHYSYKGDPVYLLGVDNMPYVSPDIIFFQAMPNGYRPIANEDIVLHRIPGAIPNAAILNKK